MATSSNTSTSVFANTLELRSNSTLDPTSPTHTEGQRSPVHYDLNAPIGEHPTPQQNLSLLAENTNTNVQTGNQADNVTTESSSSSEHEEETMPVTEQPQARSMQVIEVEVEDGRAILIERRPQPRMMEIIDVDDIAQPRMMEVIDRGDIAPPQQQSDSRSMEVAVEPQTGTFVIASTRSTLTEVSSHASGTRGYEVETVPLPQRTSTAGSHHQSITGSAHSTGASIHQEQSVHSVHSGSVHAPASFHESIARVDSVHGSSVHGTGSIYGNVVRAGSIHGSSIHGGSVHGDSIHGSALQPGSYHAGSFHSSTHEVVGAPYSVQPVVGEAQRMSQSGSFVIDSTRSNITEASRTSGARSIEVDNQSTKDVRADSVTEKTIVTAEFVIPSSSETHMVEARMLEVPAASGHRIIETTTTTTTTTEGETLNRATTDSDIQSRIVETAGMEIISKGAVSVPVTTTTTETIVAPVVETEKITTKMVQPVLPSIMPGEVSELNTAGSVRYTTTTTTLPFDAARILPFDAARILPFDISHHSNAMITTSGATTPGTTTSMVSGYDTTTSYEASRRQVSSVVISSEFIGEPPATDMGIKYVEVPVVEEIVTRIPKREIVEVEKIVPKYEVEYRERVVETPRVEYVDRMVEKPTFHEVIVSKSVKQIQEIPREVIKMVPREEIKVVEQVVNVPGQIIEVPKPYLVENKVPVKRWIDKNMPVVVAQTIRPVVTESSEIIDVDVYEYEPQIVEVDVHVAKPLASHLAAVGQVQEYHQSVTVPAAQYNTILRSINSHVAEDTSALPYIREGVHVPFLGGHETPGTTSPVPHAQILSYDSATGMMTQGGITARGITTTGEMSQYNTNQYHANQYTSNTGAVITTTSSTAGGTTVPGINVITTTGSTYGAARSIHGVSVIGAGGSVIHPTTGSVALGSTKLVIQSRAGSEHSIEGSVMNKSAVADAMSQHKSHYTHHTHHTKSQAHKSFSPSQAGQKKKRACGC